MMSSIGDHTLDHGFKACLAQTLSGCENIIYVHCIIFRRSLIGSKKKGVRTPLFVRETIHFCYVEEMLTSNKGRLKLLCSQTL